MFFLLLLYKRNKKHKEDTQKQTDYCSNKNYQPAVGLYAVFWRIGSLINIHRMHSFFFNFYGAQQGKLLLQIAQTADKGGRQIHVF